MAGMDWIVPALMLIYLAECSFAVSHSTIIFRRWFKSEFNVTFTSAFLSNEKKGLILTYPLPPFGRVYPVSSFSFSFSSQGFCPVSGSVVGPVLPSNEKIWFCPWEDLKQVVVTDSRLQINSFSETELFTADDAKRWGQFFKLMITVPEKERETRIHSFLESFFQKEQASAQLTASQNQIKIVNRIALIEWIFLFLFLPFFILIAGFAETGMYWLIAFLLVHFSLVYTSGLYGVSRKPDVSWIKKAVELFHLFISPFYAMRTGDRLAIVAFSGIHPVVVSELLLLPDKKMGFLLKVKNDLRNPVAGLGLSDSISEAVRETNLKVLGLLEKYQLSVPDLIPSTEADFEMNSYCPRCLTPYKVESGFCSDCQGIELIKQERIS